MIFEKVELHNVVEIEQRPREVGVRLMRFPKTVRDRLSSRGRFISQESTGCEIRFVTPADNVRVSLMAVEADGEVHVFRGDFLHSTHKLAKGVISVLHLESPKRLPMLRTGLRSQFSFSPDVWRVVTSRYQAAYVGVDAFGADIRPPTDGEKPAQRWLAYGSSITHAVAPGGYVHQAARRLGVDVLNCGLAGSCHCEPEVGAFLADRKDWDFATLEVGINMRGVFEPAVFAERAEALVTAIHRANPERPLAIIGMYTNYASDGVGKEKSRDNDIEAAFNSALRQIADRKSFQATFIDGKEILTDVGGLTCDLIHPSDFGHAIMAENLARRLRATLPTASTRPSN